jgi:spoIIIJ-associated protein
VDEKSRSIEITARSVDEAVLEALQQLGLTSEEVEVEVIKRGSRGLLGLLSEDAVVRVTAKAPAPVSVSIEEAPAAPVAADQEEIARLGVEVLQNLVDRMGLRARVAKESTPLESQTDSDSVLLNVSGEDLGVLIGRRGETLRDLQFLTCLIISRHIQRWPNLIVDVEHYKARREKSLTDLALRMADRVRISGQSMPLEPMPPHERRIVHLALKDDPDVFTESVGQDERRKVVIMLKM